jgi:hypothetical protein
VYTARMCTHKQYVYIVCTVHSVYSEYIVCTVHSECIVYDGRFAPAIPGIAMLLLGSLGVLYSVARKAG